MKLKQWAQEWFAAWQASHAGSYRTAQSYQGLLQNTILPCLGRYELAELTPLRLKRFFAGLPGGKAKNTYKLLRTILQQGVTAGLLAENPCTPEILGEEVFARRKAGPHREQPVFTREEREKLLAVCEEELWGNLIRFAFATGLPQGEVLALRKEDVDLAASRLTVRNRVAALPTNRVRSAKPGWRCCPSSPIPSRCRPPAKALWNRSFARCVPCRRWMPAAILTICCLPHRTDARWKPMCCGNIWRCWREGRACPA